MNTQTKPNKAELKKFGIIMAGFIAIIFGLAFPLIFTSPFSPIPWSIAMVFLILGLILPNLLHWPYIIWLKFGHALGWLNTRVLLILVFYLLITPMGLLMRLLGKNPLNKTPASADSYRIQSKPRDKSHMEKPY